jgi:hypothetical protein
LSAQGCFIFPRQAPAPAPRSASAKKTEVADSANRAAGLKPYNEVVTSTARTTNGLFRTHRLSDTLYFEIRRRELNRDLLLVGRFARASAGGPSYGGDEFTEGAIRLHFLDARAEIKQRLEPEK